MDATSGDDRLWALLDRFLAGECTGEEAQEVRAWLAADPAHRELLEGVRRIREIAADRPPTRSAEAAWKRAVEELGLGAEAPRVAKLPQTTEKAPFEVLTMRPPRSLARGIMRAAAVLALVAGGVAVWQARRQAAPVVGSQATFTQYVTQRGQRLSLRLADGTLVLLAPGSTLKKPSTYGAGERTLYLTGEAYFDVTHDSANPFTVHTAGAVARDLGTRFVVRAYAGDSTTDVVVAEGKVVLQAGAESRGAGALTKTESPTKPAKPAILTAGQFGRVEPGGTVTVRSRVDLEDYLAWTEGRLVFRDTPLQHVARQLARWYDVDIRLSDPEVGKRRLTASFDEQPVTEVFEKIAGPLGLEVTRSGKVYTLDAR